MSSFELSLDGAARIGATLSGELLNAVFANIGQRAIRKVARETFEHLLNLDLKFHLERQTGGLTRAIDRGTKYNSFLTFDQFELIYYSRGITFLLQSIIFRIVPTALEISMVCGILVRLWLIHFSNFHEVKTPFRHTNLDGILPLLRL